MFCPNCHNEFLAGITECSDCRSPLVKHLGPVPVKKSKQMLKTATMGAIAAVSYSFLAKTGATLFPKLFFNQTLARINVVLYLISSLVMVFFFYIFLKECVKESQLKLKTGTLLVLVGYSVLVLIRVFILINVFNPFVFPPSPGFYDLIRITVPMILGLCLIIFFYAVYLTQEPSYENSLKKAAGVATIVIGVFTVFQFLSWLQAYFINLEGVFAIMSANQSLLTILGLAMPFFIYLAEVWFFISLYNHRDNLKRLDLS